MKKLFLFLLAIPSISYGQTDTIITYSNVEKVDSVSKDELYSRAQTWFNASFKSAKDVLQILDKESGHLAGKGWGNVYFKQKAALGMSQTITTKLEFSIDVWVKDGKYKYIITNVDATDQSAAKYHYGMLTSSNELPIKMTMVSAKKGNEFWMKLKNEAELFMGDLGKTLHASMSKPTGGENW